jgi:hypothetical protein
MAHLTLFNVGICLVVALGSFSYGFGFGVFITSIGEPGFYVYFNLDREFDAASGILFFCLGAYYSTQLRLNPLQSNVSYSPEKLN